MSKKVYPPKRCNACQRITNHTDLAKDASKKDGVRNLCKTCDRERKRKHRLASPIEPLQGEDFAVGVANGETDPRASKDHKQQFTVSMGDVLNGLRYDALDEKDGAFIAALAESEQRFTHRRLARGVSIAVAREALHLRQFKQVAEQVFSARIQPTGYALNTKQRHLKRSVVAVLSDLHLGSNLSGFENPIPFEAIQEARRLEHIVRNHLEFKPQYRDQSELVLLLNGDLIEGNLQHDQRSGAPLIEQKAVFWQYMGAAMALYAEHFPKVHVYCQPGNHGRDKLRHEGRATVSKWDGHEWGMMYALQMMCSNLTNVTFHIPRQAVSLVPLHGSTLLLTHGDTEIKLGDPDTKAEQNAAILERINANRLYGCHIDAAVFGHFHKPRYQPRSVAMVWNGALVPPNGYARSAGYIGEPCGQWVWEAVEGFPVGDLRFIRVGETQDRDETLGKLIKPFRFEL